MSYLSNFNEYNDSQLPAINLLCKLGFKYLDEDQILAARGNNLSNVIYKLYHANVNFLDSPSTTAETTYSVQCKSTYGGSEGYFYINKPATTDNQPYHASASSNLTLIEIAA